MPTEYLERSLSKKNVNLQLEREAWAGDVDSENICADMRGGQITEGDKEPKEREDEEGTQRCQNRGPMGGPHFRREEKAGTDKAEEVPQERA